MCFRCNPERTFVIKILNFISNHNINISDEIKKTCRCIRNTPTDIPRKDFNAYLVDLLKQFKEGQNKSCDTRDIVDYSSLYECTDNYDFNKKVEERGREMKWKKEILFLLLQNKNYTPTNILFDIDHIYNYIYKDIKPWKQKDKQN